MSDPKYSLTLPREMRARWQKAAEAEDLVLSVWIRRNCEERLLLEDVNVDSLGRPFADQTEAPERDIVKDETEADDAHSQREAEIEQASAKLAEMLERPAVTRYEKAVEAEIDAQEIVDRLRAVEDELADPEEM